MTKGIVDRHLGQALECTHTVTEGTILTDRRNCSSTSQAKGIVILTSRASPRAYTYLLTVHRHRGHTHTVITVTEGTFLTDRRNCSSTSRQALERTHTVTEGTILTDNGASYIQFFLPCTPVSLPTQIKHGALQAVVDDYLIILLEQTSSRIMFKLSKGTPTISSDQFCVYFTYFSVLV